MWLKARVPGNQCWHWLTMAPVKVAKGDHRVLRSFHEPITTPRRQRQREGSPGNPSLAWRRLGPAGSLQGPRPGVAKEAFKLRAELVERSIALTLDRGSMHRAWLRGHENQHKRYLVHVAGYNFELIMRLLIGPGTPRELLARVLPLLLVLTTPRGLSASSSSSPPAPKP